MPHDFPPRLTKPRELSYDRATIAFHWLTAALVGALWLIGQTIDFAPSGPLRVDYLSLHITLGVTLVVVLVLRVNWRATRGRSLPQEGGRLPALAAKTVHHALYLLLAVTLVLGMLNVWVRGESIFNLFQIPALSPGDKALRHLVGGWHALAANGVLIVAGLHAAAGLGHHYVLRDNVLRRMVPWLR